MVESGSESVESPEIYEAGGCRDPHEGRADRSGLGNRRSSGTTTWIDTRMVARANEVPPSPKTEEAHLYMHAMLEMPCK